MRDSREAEVQGGEGGAAMTTPEIVDSADIAAPGHLDPAWFSDGGRSIDNMSTVLAAFDVGRDDDLAASLPEIINVGVHKTPTGVIQDPAGSAVGSRSLSGGGASGAIYSAFGDLMPIPNMRVGAAVFNRSTGPGRRVLHTYSPRSSALVTLATAYANALLAVAARGGEIGADGELCNLVPISGAIFAGEFRRERFFMTAHLDPSYTLVALVVAIAHVRGRGAALPPLTLCYFGADVARRAVEVRAAIHAALVGA
jgi:hypothetical protein